jgi:hypothetical protein
MPKAEITCFDGFCLQKWFSYDNACTCMFPYSHSTITGQQIVKALMFNGQRIVRLCKSLTLNAVHFSKIGNG